METRYFFEFYHATLRTVLILKLDPSPKAISVIGVNGKGCKMKLKGYVR